MKRCSWPGQNRLMIEYHDKEWGVPVHDDRKHFEFLVLDSFQAGLSWAIVLKKRDGFKKAFSDFDPKKVAQYTEDDIERLREDKSIIRNRLKIKSTVTNAQEFLRLQKEHESFDKYIWQFTDHKTIQNSWKNMKDIPTSTPESDAMSKSLKKEGFKFVGTTICYAYMQAAGMVNDHTLDCYRHKELKNE